MVKIFPWWYDHFFLLSVVACHFVNFVVSWFVLGSLTAFSQLGFLGTLWPSHKIRLQWRELFVKNCVSGSVYRSLILCRMLLLTHMIVWRVEGMLISAKSELVSSAHVCIIRCNERSLGTAARILMQFKYDFPPKSVVAQWIRWRTGKLVVSKSMWFKS